MRVLILDILLSQQNERRIPTDVLPRIYKEYEILAAKEREGRNSIIEYLRSKDGKQFEGIKNKRIYKYDLTDGDRILYTYGMPEILPDMQSSDIVLLGYAKHDDQSFFAKNANFFERSNITVTHVQKIVDAMRGMLSESFWDEHEDDWSQKDVDDYIAFAACCDEAFVKDHYYHVVSDESFANLSPEQYDKVLTQEQKDVIDGFLFNQNPTLILGGAGTGKTIIGVRLIGSFQNEGYKGLYITQSYELREKVKHIYEGISHEEINCIELNDYCIKILGKSRRNFVETSQFVEDFFDRVCDSKLRENAKKNGIDSMDIWTEIRGVIKGSMDLSWNRTQPIKQEEGFTGSINNLISCGYFCRCADDQRKIILADSMRVLKKKAKADSRLSVSDNQNLSAAFKHFSKFDQTKKGLTKTEYLGLPEEASTIDKEQRSIVWKVYNCYQEWLEQNSMYDDNDLVREAVDKVSPEDKADFVFTDEIQDFTELQIFFIKSLCKDEKKLVFAGDGNQNVNPTLFNEDRLKELFCNKDGKTCLTTKHLVKNHRCPAQVVSVANSIADLRRKTIGSGNQLSEADAYSSRNSNPVIRLLYSPENIKLLVKELFKYPGTAILVPSEEVKKALGNDLSDNKIIYTVPEIKGMEYQYVVCFDLFGNYGEIWSRMINEKSEFKHKTKYRYYFNIIYVAATRSMVNLCFVDKKIIKAIDERLGLCEVESFSLEKLGFASLHNELSDWFSFAQQFEFNKKYEDAIDAYKKSKHFASVKDIQRCQAEILYNKRDFVSAVKYAICAGKIDRAKELKNEIDEDSPLGYILSVISGSNKVSVDSIKKFGRIKRIIKQEFTDVDGADTKEITKLVTDSLRKIANDESSEYQTIVNKLYS